MQTITLSNWTETIETYLRLGLTVSGGKGDSTAEAAEKSQEAFNNQLMQTFTTQFNNQQGTLNYLKGVLTPMIANPTGYSAPALAAMRTNATDSISGSYQNAQKALQNNQAVESGDLPSGVNDQLDASLLNSEAADKATSQNDITLQNENLKESNYWNAINGLNGVAVENNPDSLASTATSGAAGIADLSQAVTASSGPTIGALIGGAIGATGTALSGGSAGKLFG